ncbi:hypothetical protein GBAR_LOCUS10307 [Geodia barretti]|uniref:Uncharacterized protein n=1 Tax=Geodia barretti TaxID=519541 RepID=A0AA35RU07_GEOBA|nr:hypothetical protein GBAR_LOCUS10307 [Geodia barretti]
MTRATPQWTQSHTTCMPQQPAVADMEEALCLVQGTLPAGTWTTECPKENHTGQERQGEGGDILPTSHHLQCLSRHLSLRRQLLNQNSIILASLLQRVRIVTRSRRGGWSMTSLLQEGLKQLLRGTLSVPSSQGWLPVPPFSAVCVYGWNCRCKALDSLAVVEFLRQKLQDQDQTQVVLRTLFVVEAMLKSDIPEVFSQMDLILQELHSLTTSTNTTIRAKAKKIMQQLAVEEETRNMASTERNISSSSQSGSGGVSVTVVSGAILDLGEGGEEGGGGERESTDQSLPPDMAGLFAGMSVSNQSPNVPPNVPLTGPPTAMVPSRQRHTSPQQKRPQHSTAADQTESASPFGDLLGLSSSSPSQLTSTITEQDPRQTEEEREGEPSLMVLEDERDVNFDPLAAGTDLVGSKSNAVTGSVSLGKPRTAPPPSSGSNEVMSELSGLDLTVRSQTDTRFQNGIGTSILQSHALDSSSFVSSSSVSTTTLGSTPLVPGVAPSQIVGGVYGRVQMPGQVPYMGPGSVPYGMQPGQAMPPQPRLGGDARPVQRPLVMAATDSHDSQSSFDFLGKSSKGAAFDFVKEEIDIAKKK